ncbi:MAG: DUF3108 domain-containing protein [Campylobacterota bacterium]|nr:DUF3108 domain-containing protein [Campylobacterota bacterium]
MIRLIILILLLPYILYGLELNNSYKVTYGVVGKVGYAHTYIKKDENSYQIKVDVKTKGIAKFLSNNRKEFYESKGSIVGTDLLPQEYTKIKTTNSYKKIKKYTFNHDEKKVYLEKTAIYKNSNKTKKSKELYKLYAKNDILTLYFNMINLVKNEPKDYFAFKTIGSKENNGTVEIIKPSQDELKDIKKLIGIEDDYFLKVKVHQKIFSSSDGELIINIDDKNVCNKTILKDVILFGDITAVKQ